jgi:hypothetical protein
VHDWPVCVQHRPPPVPVPIPPTRLQGPLPQFVHDAPSAPHAELVSPERHSPFAAQQPLHVVASQTHRAARQVEPPGHFAHRAPPVPQAESAPLMKHVPRSPQQPVGQVLASQTSVPQDIDAQHTSIKRSGFMMPSEAQ